MPPALYAASGSRNAGKLPRPFLINAETDRSSPQPAPSIPLPTNVSPAALTTETAVVRRVLSLNSGRIEGSVQQLDGENIALDGSSLITHDLLVPGTPAVQINGNPTFAGTLQGTGNPQPSTYTVTIKGNASLRNLITRTDPLNLLPIPAPPLPAGTRDVALTQAGQNPGDFASLRDLTLSGQAGLVAVPPGTYGKFTAGGQTGLVFGVQGSSTPTVYNLQGLTLNGSSTLRLAGPVILTVATGVTLNSLSLAGEGTNPLINVN